MTGTRTFVQKLTDFFKAMGNEKRQEILLAIFSDRKEHNITEVAGRAGIAQSTASEHLFILKRAGVLTSRKVEKEVYYKMDTQGILRIVEEIKAALKCCED